MTKKSMFEAIKKRYSDIHVIMDGDTIIVSAEDGTELNEAGTRCATIEERKNYDGYPLADYWECMNWDSYLFGIHGGFHEWLESNGFYAEWINPGCFAVSVN